jgi:hypothetical protein
MALINTREKAKRVSDVNAPWPSHPLEVRSGINDTWNSFQCANKGRSVTTAEWKAAQLLLMVAKRQSESDKIGQSALQNLWDKTIKEFHMRYTRTSRFIRTRTST